MKKPISFFSVLGIMIMLMVIGACTTEERSDTPDKTLTIGDQEWMLKNLDVGTFRNGDPIPEAKTKEEWIKAYEENKPAWCYYYNDSVLGKKYGRLYNVYAANDKRGLSPQGWYIPTRKDWSSLVREIGSEAGKKMKSSAGWNDNGNGSNLSEFNALPGGSRYGNGGFYGLSDYAVFGTSDGNSFFLTTMGSLRGSLSYRKAGLAIRCVRRKYYEGYDIVPSGIPNDGIMFRNNEASGRSGHSGSAITECINGDILAFYANTSGIITGGHTTPGWSEYKRSKDGGKTWGEAVVFDYSKNVWESNRGGDGSSSNMTIETDALGFREGRMADGSSFTSSMVMSVTTAPNGNIVAIAPIWWFSNPPVYLVSTDNGNTWSGPKSIDENATGDEVGRTYNGSAIVHDGTVYAAFIGGQHFGPVSLYASTDNGITFTKRGDNLFATRLHGRNYFYLTASVLDDGSLIVYAYPENKDEHNAPYVISKDKGYTWSEVQYTYFEKKIRNPQMSEKIGNYYFLTSRTGNRGGGTGNLVLYASSDGINWDSGVLLNNTGGGNDSYSANGVIGNYDRSKPKRLLIQSSHGYDGSRVNVKHWWIENVAGTSVSDVARQQITSTAHVHIPY